MATEKEALGWVDLFGFWRQHVQTWEYRPGPRAGWNEGFHHRERSRAGKSLAAGLGCNARGPQAWPIWPSRPYGLEIRRRVEFWSSLVGKPQLGSLGFWSQVTSSAAEKHTPFCKMRMLLARVGWTPDPGRAHDCAARTIHNELDSVKSINS